MTLLTLHKGTPSEVPNVAYQGTLHRDIEMAKNSVFRGQKQGFWGLRVRIMVSRVLRFTTIRPRRSAVAH